MHGIKYRLENNKATVIGITTSNSQVTIPISVPHNGSQYRVTSIGQSAFRYCSAIRSITIPSSVTKIGYWAFAHCKDLTDITIEHHFESIGDVFDGAGRSNGKNTGRPLCEKERKKRNKLIIRSIRLYLEALRTFVNKTPHDYEYLLGQIIRQYEPAEDHQHVSVRAWNLWQIQADTKEDIRQFQFDWTYTLAANSQARFNNKKRAFNKEFIQEHTIPVSDIKQALKMLGSSINDKSISAILEKMHISRIVKDGDNNSITKNSGRGLIFEEVVNSYYHNIEFQCSANKIGYEAFKECDKLQNITIGIKTISAPNIAKLIAGKRIKV